MHHIVPASQQVFLNLSHIIHLHHTQEDSLDLHYSLALSPHNNSRYLTNFIFQHHSTTKLSWNSLHLCWDDIFYTTICVPSTYARRLYCPMSLSNGLRQINDDANKIDMSYKKRCTCGTRGVK